MGWYHRSRKITTCSILWKQKKKTLIAGINKIDKGNRCDTLVRTRKSSITFIFFIKKQALICLLHLNGYSMSVFATLITAKQERQSFEDESSFSRNKVIGLFETSSDIFATHWFGRDSSLSVIALWKH